MSNGNTNLLQSFVCYADILGFSQMSLVRIHQGRGNEFLAFIRKSLNEAYENIRRELLDNPEIDDFNLKVFTDNIVIGFPIKDISFDGGEPELGRLINMVSAYQMKLAMDGLFIRGAISFGYHYMDDDIVLGDALIEAHSLDNEGRPPRIVLAESMKAHIKEHFGYYSSPEVAPQFDELLLDSDNEIFLNYLDEAFSIFPDRDIFFECLEGHKSAIEKNFEKYSNNLRVRQKYEWAARYHNFVCREMAEKYPLSNDLDQGFEYKMESESANKTLDYLILDYEGEMPRRIDAHTLANL